MRSTFMNKTLLTFSATASRAICNKYHKPFCSVNQDNCVSVYVCTYISYIIKINIHLVFVTALKNFHIHTLS